MRVVPVFATLVEGTIGAEEEDKGERVALVLLAYMRHAGVDTSAIDRIVYLRSVGCDIVRCGLSDLIVDGNPPSFAPCNSALCPGYCSSITCPQDYPMCEWFALTPLCHHRSHAPSDPDYPQPQSPPLPHANGKKPTA